MKCPFCLNNLKNYDPWYKIPVFVCDCKLIFLNQKINTSIVANHNNKIIYYSFLINEYEVIGISNLYRKFSNIYNGTDYKESSTKVYFNHKKIITLPFILINPSSIPEDVTKLTQKILQLIPFS